jgi:hypothetical protein
LEWPCPCLLPCDPAQPIFPHQKSVLKFWSVCAVFYQAPCYPCPFLPGMNHTVTNYLLLPCCSEFVRVRIRTLNKLQHRFALLSGFWLLAVCPFAK